MVLFFEHRGTFFKAEKREFLLRYAEIIPDVYFTCEKLKPVF